MSKRGSKNKPAKRNKQTNDALDVIPLGEGDYGVVCLGYRNKEGFFAVKFIKDHMMYYNQEIISRMVKRELVLNHYLRHLKYNTTIDIPNIFVIPTKETSLNDIDFEMPFYPGGDMYDFIMDTRVKENVNQIFTPCRRLIVLFGIAVAMKTFHNDFHVLYRDFNPKNVLLDSNLFPRLCDYSSITPNKSKKDLIQGLIQKSGPDHVFTKLMQDRDYICDTNTYTPVVTKKDNEESYISVNARINTETCSKKEEMWKNYSYSPDDDIFSFGLFAYFVITGDYPLKGIKLDVRSNQIPNDFVDIFDISRNNRINNFDENYLGFYQRMKEIIINCIEPKRDQKGIWSNKNEYDSSKLVYDLYKCACLLPDDEESKFIEYSGDFNEDKEHESGGLLYDNEYEKKVQLEKKEGIIKCAEIGISFSNYMLGHIYNAGIGEKKDIRESIKYFENAGRREREFRNAKQLFEELSKIK